MADEQQWFSYRVHGFGKHIEQKTVQFVEQLDDLHSCNWCGLVSAYLYELSCSHAVCSDCVDDARKARVTVCAIDKQAFSYSFGSAVGCVLQRKIVRCVNFGSGCNYEGHLEGLNIHLEETCTYYIKECFKCGECVAYKDFIGHFKVCKGVAGVFIPAADGLSLLDDIGNVSTELEHALTATTSGVRDAVRSVTEQLGSLRRQLTVSTEVRADGVASDNCNQ